MLRCLKICANSHFTGMFLGCDGLTREEAFTASYQKLEHSILVDIGVVIGGIMGSLVLESSSTVKNKFSTF